MRRILIRIYTVCRAVIDLLVKLLFAAMDVSKFREERAHVWNSGVKRLNDFFVDAHVISNVTVFQITHWQSPYMHAYFPALNCFPSLLGDMLADAINCLGFTWVRLISGFSLLVATIHTIRPEQTVQIQIRRHRTLFATHPEVFQTHQFKSTAGPEVIKLFSCSPQLSMKFVLLFNRKLRIIIAEHEIFSANEYENANNSWHFHIY